MLLKHQPWLLKNHPIVIYLFFDLSTMLDNIDQTKLAGAGAVGGALLLALTYSRTHNATPKRVQEEKYQGGESYADPPKVQTGILEDLKAMGSLKAIVANAQTLYGLAKNKGKPDDDKKMTVRCISNFGVAFSNC